MKNKIYHIACSFALALMLTTSFMVFTSESHAISVIYKEKLCERNFYGSNYKPYLEKTCGLLWSHWSYQILNTFE